VPRTLVYPTTNLIYINVYRMITMHARPRRQTDSQKDGRTNIMEIARQFVLTNASRANKTLCLVVAKPWVLPSILLVSKSKL